MRRKSNEEHLGDDLANAMDKANGAKVGDVLRPILLGQESNVGKVKPMIIGDMEVQWRLFIAMPWWQVSKPGFSFMVGIQMWRHVV
jgi:hypothetical protein